MPSQVHSLLVDLFRTAPGLAPDVLRALGVGDDVFRATTPRLVDTTFPVQSPDYHVDLAVVCHDERGAARLVILVEVQLAIDARKLRSWPLYQAAAVSRYECDACVLVVAIDERVSAWASAAVPLGPGGSVFRAVVLGPSVVLRLAGDKGNQPAELALLAALCQGKRVPELIEWAVASIATLEQVDEKRGRAYFDLLRYHLSEALDRALEAIMATSEHKYLSDFARKYYGEGEAAGRAEGEAKGAREALLIVIAARGITLDQEGRSRIDACTDITMLDAWLACAAQAAAVGDVFGDD